MRFLSALSLFVLVVAVTATAVFNFILSDDTRGRLEETVRSFPFGNLFAANQFTVSDVPDLTGKVAIVTGANVGIGYETSLALAAKNAHVVMACRSVDRCQKAADEIKPYAGPKGKVEVLVLDLSSFKSVLAFVDAFKAKKLPLHILVNNAGIMMSPFQRTADGIESQFGINHFGHYVLTKGLLDVLVKSAPSRIVVLSSLAHRRPIPADPEGLYLSHINDEASYNPSEAYSRSKLANVLHARQLAKIVADKKVYVNIVHPGVVGTDLGRHIVAPLEKRFGDLKWLIEAINGKILLRPLEGALTSIYVATSPDIEKKDYRGQYFVPIAHHFRTRAAGHNETLGAELEALSESLEEELRVKYGLTRESSRSFPQIPKSWWKN